MGVYASKADGHMVWDTHPKALLHDSPVAAIINSKYVNTVPHDFLYQKLYEYPVIQADETPCLVI